jgi:tRNA(Ile)-lysidine synthase
MTHSSSQSPSPASLKLPPVGDSFMETMRREVRDRGLIKPQQSVIVACSGGADSTALLVAMRTLRDVMDFHLSVAHVNHRLRGETANQDARWVQELSDALGIECRVGSCDIANIRTHRKGSVEETARWARWSVLESIRESVGAELIATAHHQNDQAETLLLHMLRGAGLRGIAGMSWGPERGVIRPFLGTLRDEIHAALERWGVPWREDASNSSTEHDRNRLRLELLPQLAREWNPGIIATLGRLAEIAATDDSALDSVAAEVVGKAVSRCSDELVLLDVSILQRYHSGIRRRVIRQVAEQLRTVDRALSYAETDRLAALIDRHGHTVLRGRVDAWSGIVHGDETLWIEAADAWSGPDLVEVPGEVHILSRGILRATVGEKLEPGSESLNWPEAALNPPVVVRRWQPGDRIAISRDRIPELIAAQARKAGVGDARGVLVVEDGREILWAVGVVKAEPPPGPADGPTVKLQWETR